MTPFDVIIMFLQNVDTSLQTVLQVWLRHTKCYPDMIITYFQCKK